LNKAFTRLSATLCFIYHKVFFSICWQSCKGLIFILRGDKLSEKRYYWIKLKTNFFEQETIDFLMSQKNGCQYIVLYQMLCLKTANTDGKLCSKIGEMIVPYDVNKIVRDTKYFDFDTVTVALELFKQLGLIYIETDDNTLQIANYGEMVGSETSSAKRVREYRQRKALQCNTDVTQDIRDKILENKSKENKDLTTTAKDIRQKYDWSCYSEKEMTEINPFNPQKQLGLTIAETDMLYKVVEESALERYFIKIMEYEVKDCFSTIIKWAKQDMNYKGL